MLASLRRRVAKRAGNSVEVLLRRYAGSIDNQADAVNRQIEEALGEEDQAPEMGWSPGQLSRRSLANTANE
jgi:hypothetical protein